jgi:hypothetical protein
MKYGVNRLMLKQALNFYTGIVLEQSRLMVFASATATTRTARTLYRVSSSQFFQVYEVWQLRSHFLRSLCHFRETGMRSSCHHGGLKSALLQIRKCITLFYLLEQRAIWRELQFNSVCSSAILKATLSLRRPELRSDPTAIRCLEPLGNNSVP